MKTKILDPKNVSEETIESILDNGALEYHDNGGIYVTAYPNNFWIDLGRKRHLIFIYTYWDVVPEVDEIDILRFVNHANTQKIMLQFSYRPEKGRFYAHYTHPYHVGLIPTHVLKMAQKFAAIFQEVVDEGIAGGLLVAPSPSSADEDEETADVASVSTVH